MTHQKIYRMAGISLLAAVVVVLQLLAGMITIGSFPINLTLVPIVVGAAMFGPSAGAFLGAVCGIVTYIACVNGTDISGNILFAASPLLCAVVCIGKSALSGGCSGLIYRLVAGHNRSLKRSYTAAVLAALTAPVVNSGVFCLGMVLFFMDTLNAWAAGSNLFSYIIFALTGVNFLVELGINMVLSPAICTIVKRVQHKTA